MGDSSDQKSTKRQKKNPMES
jgi:GTP cyclohydrolase I